MRPRSERFVYQLAWACPAPGILLYTTGKGGSYMTSAGAGSPVVVSLPAEIDLTSLARAYAGLNAAIVSGAAVVIADFSATTFCDVASIRRLLELHRQAAARQIELRVVAPPGPVRRLLRLIEPRQPLRVSSSLGTADS
jgi:anti-anti-sigma regulatory factor